MVTKPHIVKDSIAEALFILLKTHKLKDITISELTEKAGVSRISFYRNFDSKESVVKYKLESLFVEFNHTEFANNYEIVYHIYDFLKSHKSTIGIVYNSGLVYIFREIITDSLIQSVSYDEDFKYFYRGFGYFIFGCLDSWITSGMKESPEEMVELTQKTAAKIREEILKDA